MIPILPTLSIRPLRPYDFEPVSDLINRQLGGALYSRPFTLADCEPNLLREPPLSAYLARWQRHLPLCAWRAGSVVGFLDAATGFSDDQLDLPEHPPLGLCRFLALTERSDLIEETFRRLLAEAEDFWRLNGVQRVVAFHRSTGYPAFQGGAGILPGDWSEHVRALTSVGYTFTQRYYLLVRELNTLVEEEVPQPDLGLRQHRQRLEHDQSAESTYQLYHRRVETVGGARLRSLPPDLVNGKRTAHLLDLFIAEPWRHHNIGKWLLRRIINDATLAGHDELIAFVSSRQATAVALLSQQGFIEQNYRGYTLEKELG